MDSKAVGNGEILRILSQHFLFSSCPPSLLESAAAGCCVKDFTPGQVLSQYDEPPSLCILLTGAAAVYTPGEENDFLLRELHAGDTFGVANLFAAAPTVTRVVAVRPTCALCMKEDTVRHLLENDSALSMRYIGFLSDRIRFLNRRIACLGAGSAANRLAAWLDAAAPEGITSFTLPLPLNRLADTLSLGRASLYRAFHELSSSGYLVRDGRSITFMDRAGMRREVLCLQP